MQNQYIPQVLIDENVLPCETSQNPLIYGLAQYRPATERTLYFIGVTTNSSSIMKVFPAWAEALGLKAVIRGIDFLPNDESTRYREAVDFIKHDPLSLGALVTTHKINLFKASHDLFDHIGPYTQLLGEVSSISKRDDMLWGHAKDPLSVGLGLEAIVADGYWRQTGGELLVLGAGGSSLALTLYLHNKQLADADALADAPSKLIVTDQDPQRLAEMQAIHQKIGLVVPIEYHLALKPERNDLAVERLPSSSMVINATGLGKDRPGSPLTDRVSFPKDGIIWEFNYRGDLHFLAQAKAQQAEKMLKIEDGWVYFIHGWTRVIAEVFEIDIPTSGPKFEQLSEIAQAVNK